MSETSTNPPSYDKVVMDSGEPLVLRPPVGSAVYQDSKFSFNPIFSQHHSRSRRSGLVYVFVFLLILLTIAGVLMILFLFGLGPLAFAYKQDRLHQHHQSICRIRIPFLKIDPIESVSADENSLNVSISSLPTYNMIRILHSFEDRLTVIRTNDHCYIRPIRADLMSDSAADYVKRLNEGSDLQESVSGRVYTEPWFVDQSPSSHLYSSLVMAWCTGVPVYRLVSQPPSDGYQIDNPPPQVSQLLGLNLETDVDSSFHDSFESDDDDDTFDLTKSNTYHPRPINIGRLILDDSKDAPMLGGGRFRRNTDVAAAMGLKPDQIPVFAQQQSGGRFRRNTDVATALGRKPNQIPISAQQQQKLDRFNRSIDFSSMMERAPDQLPVYAQMQDTRSHCTIVDDILEDAPIPSHHQSNHVPVIRDVIMKCKHY